MSLRMIEEAKKNDKKKKGRNENKIEKKIMRFVHNVPLWSRNETLHVLIQFVENLSVNDARVQ